MKNMNKYVVRTSNGYDVSFDKEKDEFGYMGIVLTILARDKYGVMDREGLRFKISDVLGLRDFLTSFLLED